MHGMESTPHTIYIFLCQPTLVVGTIVYKIYFVNILWVDVDVVENREYRKRLWCIKNTPIRRIILSEHVPIYYISSKHVFLLCFFFVVVADAFFILFRASVNLSYVCVCNVRESKTCNVKNLTAIGLLSIWCMNISPL